MQFLTTILTVDTVVSWAYTFALALSISILAVFGGALVLACVAQYRHKRTRLSVFSKGARQWALLGLGFGWLSLVALRVWLYFFPDKLFEFCWLGMMCTVLLQTVHFTFWKKLSKNSLLAHVFLLVFNALLNFPVALLSIYFLRLQVQSLFGDMLPVWGVLQAFLELNLCPQYGLYFEITSTSLTALLSLAAPAVWGCICLPVFKKHQDFGRDHYKVMVRWSASWARNIWGILWLLQCILSLAGNWLLWQTVSDANAEVFLSKLTVLTLWQMLWLFPILAWSITSKSTQPLRHAGVLFIALLAGISFF